jgi:tetratricopeptide (TPR) repeat protein
MKETFLSHFTPSMMQPETLEKIFVQRQSLAQDLVERISESVLTPAKHHALLIGARGMGKTHLVSLIYHRIRAMQNLHDRLLIAWLREEEWGITSFLDLLLRILRVLAEENPKIAEQSELLYALSPEAAEVAATRCLKEIIGDRTLLLLVENLDDLFTGLGEAGQQSLRAFLQETACCTMLATAQRLFSGVSRRTSPFYGFFRPLHLEKLTLEEAIQLVKNIAKLQGKTDLSAFLQTPTGRARIRAVEHLAGGNHRVYTIFAQFLTRESLDDLVEPFMQMLDDLTPYYQARMNWLSPQQRKIVECLCDRRHAVTVKEIAQRCFISHPTTSSQLKDLREKGYVSAKSVGRESYYELCEPLMRLCIEVKKHRSKPIQLFVDFLRLWYLPRDLKQQLELLSTNTSLEYEYILHALKQIEEKTDDPRIESCEADFNCYWQKDEYDLALKVAEELVAIRGNGSDCRVQGFLQFLTQSFEAAIVSFDHAIQLEPDYSVNFAMKGRILLENKLFDQALACLNQAVELNPEDSIAWKIRGEILFNSKQYNLALTSFANSIELDSNDEEAWFIQGLTLTLMGHYNEAIDSLDQSLSLNPDHIGALNFKGIVLAELRRYEESLHFFKIANALDLKATESISDYAEVLISLNLWDEGIVVLGKALRTSLNQDDYYIGLDRVIPSLLCNIQSINAWQIRIVSLVELFDKYDAVAAVGEGLTQSITDLVSPIINDAIATKWLEVWQQVVGDRPEFQLPLRLLKTAVRYKQTPNDPRVLLELPIEERKLLEPLLEINQELLGS